MESVILLCPISITELIPLTPCVTTVIRNTVFLKRRITTTMAAATDSLPAMKIEACQQEGLVDDPDNSRPQESTANDAMKASVRVNAHVSVDPWSPGLRNRKPRSEEDRNSNSTDADNDEAVKMTMTMTPLAPWPAARQIQMLPSRSSSSYDNAFEDDEDECPASRAAAAVQALACRPLHEEESDDEDDHHHQQQQQDERTRRLCRMETTHTSHISQHSSLDKFNDNATTGACINNAASSEKGNLSTCLIPDPDAFPFASSTSATSSHNTLYKFSPTLTGRMLTFLSSRLVPPHLHHTHGGSALAGFLALLLVTCANYVLGPMRDAAALAVGVSHIPALTLASTVLALGSSVPVGWLFEAPDPRRRRLWRRMGLTRGETQGTSLALFYRVFGFLLWSYAVGFWIVERAKQRREEEVDRVGRGTQASVAGAGGLRDENHDQSAMDESILGWIGILFMRILHKMGLPVQNMLDNATSLAGELLFGIPTFLSNSLILHEHESIPSLFLRACTTAVNKFGSIIYIMFFLVVHLMKLHSLSLIWGVTTEAMEYEENAERRRRTMEEKEEEMMSMTAKRSAGGLVMMGSGGAEFGKKEGTSPQPQCNGGGNSKTSPSAVRLKRLGFVGFGGTLGGILGSLIASFAAHILHLSGLLVLAAVLLEISANLSIELGRIMQRHWEEQIKYASCGDLASLGGSELSLNGSAVDSSMRKSVSLGSMKRIASSQGNLAQLYNNNQAQSDSSGDGGGGMTRAKSIGTLNMSSEEKAKAESTASNKEQPSIIDDNSFKQRLLRGVTTILRSRLLMAIFTYNALYASTSVLLSFQRAELVANRSSTRSSAVSNTAFLAKINTASSVAVFGLQASGLGALIANSCGQRGALALMPIIRLGGIFLLGWWHWWSGGQPPDLILFLVIDEFTKVINFAIAKPVRENLWRGLSAEARYEAKPIVDTLANRWGGGSAAFLVSFINRITDLTGLGEVNENGDRTIFGFPPVLLLCMIISAWWTAVSADVGNIRRKIDLELKKQQ
ncbi:hypothetical protein ACHAWX_007333 [Stephanocyclus meneghinianus]